MLDNSQDGARGAMPPESACAPFAPATVQIDLADYAASDQFPVAGLHHLSDELMSGRALKPVVAALQLQIRIADASAQEADSSESFRDRWHRPLANLNAALL